MSQESKKVIFQVFGIGPIFINFLCCHINWQHILILLNQTFYVLGTSYCEFFKIFLFLVNIFLKKTLVCQLKYVFWATWARLKNTSAENCT